MATDVEAFGGAMPQGAGDLSLEGRGIAPIPEDARYGTAGRVFTVWFTPNIVPAAFFIGTLAAADFIGSAGRAGLWAILVGNVIGASLTGSWRRWDRRRARPRCRLPGPPTERRSSCRG